MEALITLNCSKDTEKVVDIIKVFQQIGWSIYNSQGKIEYLPVGDDSDYDWQCEKMSENRFYDIIAEKTAVGEQVGVNLFYNSGAEGISLLAYNTDQIMLSIVINRKIIAEGYTDMIWYMKNIMYKLFDVGVRILSYKLEEFSD